MKKLSDEQIRELLMKVPFLLDLPQSEIARLASKARQTQRETGEVALQPNTLLDQWSLVADGRLRVAMIGRGGNEFMVSMFGPGELFGLSQAVNPQPNNLTLITDRPSTLLSMPNHDLLEILEQNPKNALIFMRIIGSYCHHALEILESVVLHPPERRLWDRISSWAKLAGQRGPTTGSIRLEHGLTQQAVADSISVTRVTVNRLLRDWAARGLISYASGVLEVPDLKALEAHVLHDPECRPLR